MDFCAEVQMDFVLHEVKQMIPEIQQSRVVVIKHIMQRVCADEIGVSAGLRLIAVFDEEYQLAIDSVVRYQRACLQITDDRTIIIGG